MPLSTQHDFVATDSSTLELGHFAMIINGEECEAKSGAVLPVYNPATGKVIATVPAGAAEDVDAAVAAAQLAFESEPWKSFGPVERANLMLKLADLVERDIGEIIALESLNNGRPIIEMRAQLGRMADGFRYFAALALAQRGETVPIGPGYLCYLEKVPLGVCGVITPFNHPFGILGRGVAPALASGNTVVAKPSELTPLSSLKLAKLALEAGYPKGVFNVVIGRGAEAGAALSRHPHVRKLDFTGGAQAGRAISVAGAERFVPVTTELGGKSPVIVFEDSNFDDAVNGVAFGGFIASGQTCICGSRLLIQDSIYDKFIDALVAKIKSIRIGDPADPSTQMGPVASSQQVSRVTGYLEIARAEGARVVVGGGVPKLPAPLDEGYFIEPTLLADVDNSMRCAQEEIFGPVLVAVRFSDEADAIAKANDIAFGLGAAVWTRDVVRAHRVASAIQSGIVWINDHHRNGAAMPWGGVKESGLGKQAGQEGFDGFFSVKSVVVRVTDAPFDWYAMQAPGRLN
jgi:acyl-CoA reductase-like NAD-dependent aldehyde dehydrogenase